MLTAVFLAAVISEQNPNWELQLPTVLDNTFPRLNGSFGGSGWVGGGLDEKDRMKVDGEMNVWDVSKEHAGSMKGTQM